MASVADMVPNISPNGRSFRGAGAYHLHDKPTDHELRPRTSHRIAFTATRNLANEDPRAALDEMWRTAEDAVHLKAISGAHPQGRKNSMPVKTISLAWAPGQTPNRAEMIAAADGFLRTMGWHGHQAVYAAHDDTAHPHLHIILNRVHPETGRAINDWQERKRAQQWALAYERNQGRLLCTARVGRYETGAAAPGVGLSHAQAKLIARQSPAARHAIARETRAAFRPAWARHLRQQRECSAALARQRKSAHRLAASLAREGNAAGALDILDRFQRHNVRTLHTLAAQSAALGMAQYAAVRARVPSLVPTSQGSANNASAPVGRPSAANDNAPHHRVGKRAEMLKSGPGFRAVPRQSPAPLANSTRFLRASHRTERQLLRAMQAAAYQTLSRNGPAARQASSLARSEIAIAFAGRWADIERMPAALRAAARAALKAEQAAALSARLRYHVLRLQVPRRTERLALSRQYTAARLALAHRHKLAWAAATAPLKASRPARAPPPANQQNTLRPSPLG